MEGCEKKWNNDLICRLAFDNCRTNKTWKKERGQI